MELFHNSVINKLEYTVSGPYTNSLQKVKNKRKSYKLNPLVNPQKLQTCKTKHNSQRKEFVKVRNIAKYIGTGCCFNTWQIVKFHELELTFDFTDKNQIKYPTRGNLIMLNMHLSM